MNSICGLLLLLLLSTPPAQRKSSEEFREFCAVFFSDSTFQKARVTFPLLALTVNDSAARVDTVLMQADQWHFSDFGFLANNYNVQVYDNFKRLLRSSGERVVSFEGSENGIQFSLYFQLVEGKWYLVKWEDLSD